MFVGGVRALLLQTLHPAAMRGVAEHSGYRGDMWGRLARTSRFLAVTTFGHEDDAAQAVAMVRSIHRRVTGTMPDGTPYAASDPHLLGWVHVAEVDSFLLAHTIYGATTLTPGARHLRRPDRRGGPGARRRRPPDDRAGAGRAAGVVPPRAGRHPRGPRGRPLPAAAPAAAAAGRARRTRVLMAAGIGLLPRWTRAPLRLPWLPVSERVVVRALGTLATGTIRWAMSPPTPAPGADACLNRSMADPLRPTLSDLRWPLGDDGDAGALREALVAAYQGADRGYHDLRHLGEVLAAARRAGASRHGLRPAAGAAGRVVPRRVYDGERDAEERSAAWAEDALAGLVDAAVVAEVARLVRLTETHRPDDDDPTGCALSDADLAILAAPPARYDEYVAAVRREYAHVADDDFAARPRRRAARPARQAAAVPHRVRRRALGGRRPRQRRRRARAARRGRVPARLSAALASGPSGPLRPRTALARRSPAATSRRTSSRERPATAPGATTWSYHSAGTS